MSLRDMTESDHRHGLMVRPDDLLGFSNLTDSMFWAQEASVNLKLGN